MIEKIVKNDRGNEDRTHRRMGGAFDTIARVLRSVGEIVFRSGMVMRNRKSSTAQATFIESSSVFEMYNDLEAVANKYNLVFIGRRGTGENKNTHYLEFYVDSRTTSEPSSANGQFRIGMSRNGTNLNSNLQFVDLASQPVYVGNNGGRFFVLGGDGNEGGVQISHLGAAGSALFSLVVDGDGIQMSGLPTSSAGLAVGTIWNDAGTLKIVT